jgi:chromosomal replication initiation ATPase DnaA
MNIPYYTAPGLLRQNDVAEMITKSERIRPRTPELKKAGEDVLSDQKSHLIHDAIFDFFGVNKKTLATGSRKKEICFPRQISIYLHTQMTNYSLSKIGMMYGGRDHTTAIHSRRVITDILKQAHDTPEYKTLTTFLNGYGFE